MLLSDYFPSICLILFFNFWFFLDWLGNYNQMMNLQFTWDMKNVTRQKYVAHLLRKPVDSQEGLQCIEEFQEINVQKFDDIL
ncbi:hypothetical protein DVH24_015637 [Malus domestica]|uniref:Uncharacterized protein n=1 Tax=Malus domestica TaxID=3750 RepID=A0A498HN89_MALDO|nr:hypothetical protein DVH24_015637 [Malus domestica]